METLVKSVHWVRALIPTDVRGIEEFSDVGLRDAVMQVVKRLGKRWKRQQKTGGKCGNKWHFLNSVMSIIQIQ